MPFTHLMLQSYELSKPVFFGHPVITVSLLVNITDIVLSVSQLVQLHSSVLTAIVLVNGNPSLRYRNDSQVAMDITQAVILIHHIFQLTL